MEDEIECNDWDGDDDDDLSWFGLSLLVAIPKIERRNRPEQIC